MAATRVQSPVFGYIGGTSYSGSTLLSFLLDAQAGVTSIGEVAWAVRRVDPGSFQCSCGASLDTCAFWISVSRAMEQRGHRFDADHWDTAFDVTAHKMVRKMAVRSLGTNFAERFRDNLVRRLPKLAARLTEIGKRNAALVDAIVSVTGATAFVDASKDPNRIRFLRDYSAIQPHVIHLVRDSLAFVNSSRKKGLAVELATRWWNGTVRHMERLRRTVPAERWLVVRYEDLCKSPEAALKRILRFLGVADDAPNLDYRSRAHHIIGNRMRLGDSSDIRLDDSWRDELSKDQIDQIARSTMTYRRVFGYLDGRQSG